MVTESPTFNTTRWSLVARSGSRDAAVRRLALEELATSYWLPLYAYLRRSGSPPRTPRIEPKGSSRS